MESYAKDAVRAYSETALENILPAMREAARGCGYAIAVHGSLSRDIDLVAIPWQERPMTPDELIQRMVGILSGYFGRATIQGEVVEKPHNRLSYVISVLNSPIYFDMCVMKPIEDKNEG